MLNASIDALVPESEVLLRQLLLWLRQQMLTLPLFANITVELASNESTPAGFMDMAVGQVKQDTGYFVACGCLQLLSLLVLLPLAVRACLWRRRLRSCRYRSGELRIGANEMSTIRDDRADNDPDKSSVNTCVTDAGDGDSTTTDKATSDNHEPAGGGSRRHACLVASIIALLILLLATAAVSVALLIHFWNSGNMLQSRMLTEPEPSGEQANGNASRAATFRASTAALVEQVNALIDDSIRSSNATLIDEFQTNFYIIQNFFNRFARNIIAQLFELLQLQPVLTELEAFISKIESVVSIQTMANQLSVELTGAATDVSKLRDELTKSCEKLCTGSSHYDCPQIMSDLEKLKLQTDSKLLQLDSLTTVVTFMKQNNINVTQMRMDFVSTYVSINASLSTIDAEVRKLLDSVSVAIASEFGKMKNSTDPVTASLTESASSDSVWSVVRDTRTYFVVALVAVSLALVPFYVFAVLLSTGLIRCLCWLLSTMAMEGKEDDRQRQRVRDLSNLGVGPDRIGDCPVGTVSAASLRRVDGTRARLREYRQRCVCSFRQLSGSTRAYAGGALAVSMATAVLFCLPVCALYVAGVAEVRVCRYLRTSEGRATLDANVDSTLLNHLWPGVTSMLEATIQLPIPFDFRKRPDRLFTRLHTQCRNSSVSLFTAFELTDVINMTEFVYSPTVLQNIDYGKGMLHTALTGLTPEVVLSPELRGIGDSAEVQVLGNLIDIELSRSDILGQLDRPLLPIDPKALSDDIDRLALRHSTAPDSVIARYYSDQLRQLSANILPQLQWKLSNLSAIINASSVSSTASATIVKLARNVGAYKVAFAVPASVMASADRVYDATVVGYLPPLTDLLDPMKSRILARLLPCMGMLHVLEAGSELACSDVIESILSVSMALLLSLLALLVAVGIFLGLLLQVSGFCCLLRGGRCCCCCGNGGGGSSSSSYT